jgi:predicted RNase H-like HicB family nuclease
MTKSPKKLRLAYRIEPEPVNGWVLARCEALDLVSQGRDAEQARTLLHEEARLYLAQMQGQGALTALLERLDGEAAQENTASIDFDLSRLS